MAQDCVMNPFVGGTYSLQGNSFGCREALNVYLQSGEGMAKYSAILIGTPGTKGLVELESLVGANQGCRGMYLSSTSQHDGGNLFWIYGASVGYTYKDAATGELKSKLVANIGLNTTRVSICDNGFECTMTDGNIMLNIDLYSDVATDITSSLPFKRPKQVVYLQGRTYCICSDPDKTVDKALTDVIKNNLIWYSKLGDAKVWGGADFTAADLNADAVQAIVVRQGDVWAFGPRSYQIFQTTADANDPLSYAPGSGTLIGTTAPDSVTAISDTVFWLGSNSSGRNIVFKATAFNSVRISNHGIETTLTEMATLTDSAYGFSYQESGHLFYVLTIPAGFYEFEGSTKFSDGKTLVYDTLTEQWHERASREPKTGKLQAWQPLFSAYAWGKVIVGNLLWPTLMELRNDIYTDYDPTTPDKRKPILRQFQGPVFYDNLQLFILDEFTVDLVAGHGPLNGLSKDPVMLLQVSHDSGNTWGSVITEKVPKTGNYGGRVRWNRLGSSRGIVVRLSFSEDMQFMMGEARIRTRTSRNP